MLSSTERDETVSWRAASLIMGLVSLYAVSLRAFNFFEDKPDLFAWEFEALILYLPTIVLLGVILYGRVKRTVAVQENAGGGGA